MRYRVEQATSPHETGGMSAAWGIGELKSALQQRGLAGDGGADARSISLQYDAGLQHEEFRIDPGKGPQDAITVASGDAAGMSLACLHLVDLLDAGDDLSALSPCHVAPAVGLRALKVNLPWASYRQHSSLDLHDEAQRDPAFWTSLLDHMAASRLNMLSLWALHPFHYMVDVPEFPEARSYPPDELAAWQELWRGVFAAAHARGIQTYVFFWNIFVSPAFMKAHNVAPYCADWHYIGDGDSSQIVKDYNRACVRTLIDTYDDLDGIGIAMSERMGGMTPAQRAQWVEEAIIPGMHDARRPVGLCLRVPHSAGLDNGGSTDKASESLGRNLLERVRVPGRLWTEIKFNWSHGHSTPHLRKIHGGEPTDVLWNPTPTKYRIAWMVRNEDFFVLRWAGPDFVREHIRLNNLPGVCGYFIGSECYIPAADYITRPGSDASYRWAFERQWLFYHVWGRLLHNPDTPDSTFEALIDHRYGQGIGRPLLGAYRLASRVPLTIATFLNFTWDHTLYAEGMLCREGMMPLDALIDADPIEPDWLSVRKFVRQGEPAVIDPPGVTPRMLAEGLERDVAEALRWIEAIPAPTGNLGDEVADIRAWAHLGLYFAAKLRAAIALARFQAGGEDAHRDEAVELAEEALAHWRRVAEITEPRYRPIPLQILGDRPFSWTELIPDAARDVQIARGG